MSVCFIFLSILLCLAQNSYGQAIGLANNFGLGPNGLGLSPGCPNAIAASNFGAPGFVNNFPLNNLGGNIAPLGYPLTGLGPVGYGDVSVLGELPVGGSTIVNGNLPVIGYVTFEGIVPAGGLVSVANGCGCNQLAF